MTLNKDTYPQAAIFIFVLSIASCFLAFVSKLPILYILGGILGFVAGLCVFLWIVSYLHDLDDRLKQIENK